MEDEKILHFVLAIFKMMLYNTPVTPVDVLNNAFTLAGVMGSDPTAASGGVKGGERVAVVDS